jgi:pimeloyl-ACP methyl ester carboxylesterase
MQRLSASLILLLSALLGGGLFTRDAAAASWTQSPATGPGARESHAMAFDSISNVTVMFGGEITNNGISTPYTDTWLFDGTTWAQTAASGPCERWAHQMAFDSARGMTVLFGGNDTRPARDFDPACLASSIDPGGATINYGDTWLFDGSSWTRGPAAGPPARAHHAMAFDSARSATVLFGGIIADTPNLYSDTWLFNGTSWSQVSVSGPSPRFFHAMAYDSVHNVTVLFGGTDNTVLFGDTWLFDGTAWHQVPGPGPSARVLHRMAFDSARGVTVLFGGNDGSNDLNDTWEFDGASWTLVDTGATPPPARRGHAMSYDSTRNATVVFGGQDGGITFFADTWKFGTLRRLVVLVHGFCGSPASFGLLSDLLQRQIGASVFSFDYANLVDSRFTAIGGIPNDQRGNLPLLAGYLARYIRQLRESHAPDEIDVVAHSMGGLITRAWMAGDSPEPYQREITKLITLATPNFGVHVPFADFFSELATSVGACEEDNDDVRRQQYDQMMYGSTFLKTLNEQWEQAAMDDGELVPENILTVVGCTDDCSSDPVVLAASATLPRRNPDYAVAYVRRNHVDIDNVDGPDHPTVKLVTAFLQAGLAPSPLLPSGLEGLVTVPVATNITASTPPVCKPYDKTNIWLGSTSGPLKFTKPPQGSLPRCDGASFPVSDVSQNAPSNKSGSFTLTGVSEGCWVVGASGSKIAATRYLLTEVTGGRPTMAPCLLVFPKK